MSANRDWRQWGEPWRDPTDDDLEAWVNAPLRLTFTCGRHERPQKLATYRLVRFLDGNSMLLLDTSGAKQGGAQLASNGAIQIGRRDVPTVVEISCRCGLRVRQDLATFVAFAKGLVDQGLSDYEWPLSHAPISGAKVRRHRDEPSQ